MPRAGGSALAGLVLGLPKGWAGTAYADEAHYLHVYVSRLRRKLAAADPSGAAAVSLRGVRKTYGDVVAVDRVSLDVSDGICFVGLDVHARKTAGAAVQLGSGQVWRAQLAGSPQAAIEWLASLPGRSLPLATPSLTSGPSRSIFPGSLT
jgi:hypothetical protein